MRNIFLVVKHEVISILQKRSFWIGGFLFPLLIFGFNVIVPMLISRSAESTPRVTPFPGNTSATQTIGYVDQAGLIKAIPAGLPPSLLKAFPDEEAAVAATADQVIDEYVIIPANYLQTGHLVVVQRNFQPIGSTPGELLKYVIDANLTGDAALAAALNQPAHNIEVLALAACRRADKQM